ncbi:D-alanine--D-alanine ligase [Desulfovibrio sp. OttesenSCG-928-F07]|nr:D-alanine--D-alanine ligase [Desulfovibrio sp. OttesenSCG-928-F07]
MNILLIAGGWSKERDVSLNGAAGIATALQNLGHKVTHYDPEQGFSSLFKAAKGQDFAFINLHGLPGEDGLPQALLDAIGLPYQGSGPAGSILALNKAAAKDLFKLHNLPTPEWVLLTSRPGSAWVPPFDYPVIIKSNTGGSSLGLELVTKHEELAPALDSLFALGGEFLVEPACNGQEVTCGVLGELTQQNGKLVEIPRALPPVLIKPLQSGTLFDYNSKYLKGGAEEICPAPLAPAITAKLQEYALTAHKALGLRGYSRTDFILLPDNTPVLLEVNTLPGMTPTSLIPQEAAAIGLSFEELVQRLIDLGLAT